MEWGAWHFWTHHDAAISPKSVHDSLKNQQITMNRQIETPQEISPRPPSNFDSHFWALPVAELDSVEQTPWQLIQALQLVLRNHLEGVSPGPMGWGGDH